MRDLFSYSLTPDQLAGAMTRNSARVMERIHTRPVVVIAGTLVLATLGAIAVQVLFAGERLGDPIGVSVPALIAFAAACALLLHVARRQGVRLLVRRSTFAPGTWQLGVDDDGLWTQGPHGESFTRWSGWRAVEEHGDVVLLFHDDVHVHPVPFAAFASGAERAAFIEHVRARIAAQPGEMRQPAVARSRPVASSPAPIVHAATAPSFGTLLRATARLITLQRVSEAELAASWLQVAGAMLLTLVPPFAFAFSSIGEAGHLAWTHLPAVLYHVPVMLVAAILVAHLIDRTSQVATLLVGSLLAWTAIDFLSLGLWLATRESLAGDPAAAMAFYYVPIAWLALATTRLALSLLPAPGGRAVWVVAAYALFLALPLAGVFRERSLWSMDDPRQAVKGEQQDPERQLAAGPAAPARER